MTQRIETREDVLSYYRQQSWYSSPGRLAAAYDPLPNELGRLCEILHHSILHRFWIGEATYGITLETLTSAGRDTCGEFSLQTVEERLANLQDLDAQPLSELRDVGARTVGCCRDFALMLTSILRHKGIPARVRTGIAKYFKAPDGYLLEDHYITEFWNQDEARWQQVDPQIDGVQRPAVEPGLDTLDLPQGRFLTGWQLLDALRRGEVDPAKVGFPPVNRGFTYGRTKLFADFVGLTGHELPVHGWWGIGDPTSSEHPGDAELVDRMIGILQGIDANDPSALTEALALVASHERLKMPVGYNPGRNRFLPGA